MDASLRAFAVWKGRLQSQETGPVFPDTFSKRCATLRSLSRSLSRSLTASGPEARPFYPPNGKEFENEVLNEGKEAKNRGRRGNEK